MIDHIISIPQFAQPGVGHGSQSWYMVAGSPSQWGLWMVAVRHIVCPSARLKTFRFAASAGFGCTYLVVGDLMC